MVIIDAVSSGTKNSKLLEHPAEVKINLATLLRTPPISLPLPLPPHGYAYLGAKWRQQRKLMLWCPVLDQFNFTSVKETA